MPRKTRIGFGLVVFFGLNAIVLSGASHGGDLLGTPQKKVRAAKIQKLGDELRRRSKFEAMSNAYDYFGSIGGLAEGHSWKKVLPLAEVQANAIMELDHLLRDARNNSYLADADYLDGNPADYREHLERSDARRTDTLHHAGYLIALGLLTEPQTALVLQRRLSSRQQIFNSLRYRVQVQDRLGLTQSQKEKLAQVAEEARKGNSRLNWFAVDPEEQKAFKVKRAAIERSTDAAVEKILTRPQQEMLSRLTAERTLPAEPPELPALSDVEAARIKLDELSPTFRVLAAKEDSLGISDEQKKLLKDLKEVTRLGLFWIGRGSLQKSLPPEEDEPADSISETRAKFLKQAEQVALLGILTQRQAEKVEEAVKEN